MFVFLQTANLLVPSTVGPSTTNNEQLEHELVEPLAVLLDDASEETRVNVVAVIRSICDHPAGRTMFNRHKIAVSKQWMDLFPTVVPA